MEREYIRLRNDAAAVGRKLNELTHSGRLPPELLVRIFIKVDPFTPGIQRCTSDAIVTVSHVCHYWREVALNSAELWQHVELGRKQDYLRMVILRSKDCSLFVTETPEVSNHLAWLLVLEGMRRVRYILLFSLFREESMAIYRSRHGEQKLAAPRLLTYMDSPGEVYYTIPEQQERALISYLHAPSLRYANLRPLVSATLRSVFSGVHSTTLRHLSISPRSGYLHRGRPSILLNDVAPALSSMPALETLELAELDYNRDAETIDPTFRIFLPSLQMIKLTGILCPCALLLTYISFPLSTRLNIVTTMPPFLRSIHEEVDAASSILTKIVATNEEQPYVLSCLSFRDEAEFSFINPYPEFTIEDWLDYGETRSNPPRKHTFILTLPSGPELIDHFRRHQHMFEVDRLQIVSCSASEALVQILDTIGSTVEVLQFVRSDLDQVNKTLMASQFPNLRVLQLLGCSPNCVMHAEGDEEDSDREGCEQCEAPVVLLRILRQRQEHNPIQRIVVRMNTESCPLWLISVEEELRAAGPEIEYEYISKV